MLDTPSSHVNDDHMDTMLEDSFLTIDEISENEIDEFASMDISYMGDSEPDFVTEYVQSSHTIKRLRNRKLRGAHSAHCVSESDIESKEQLFDEHRNQKLREVRFSHTDEYSTRHIDTATTLNIQQRLLNIAAESNPGYRQTVIAAESNPGDCRIDHDNARTKTRWIRVAGLDNNVTAKELRDHIYDVTGCRDVRCLPLYRKNVDPSTLPWVTYKLGIPDRIFHVALCKDNWPHDVEVNEFVERSNFRERIQWDRNRK